jgi:uncharacterized protein YyaL (SSP411 family)
MRIPGRFLPLAGVLLLLVLPARPAGAAANEADRARFQELCTQVAAARDSARGGFVDKSGAPSDGAVELALVLGRGADAAQWRRWGLETLGWMRGLLDTLHGGYVTRAESNKAEGGMFEKRADVNGRRLENLLAASRAAGDDAWRRDADRVVDFMDRVLIDGRGGFVTAQVGDRALQADANGAAIHAWLEWAAVNRDPVVRDFALKSIERVWATCWSEPGVLLRRNEFGDLLQAPQLTDQVEMGRALLLSHQLCGRAGDLERARRIGRTLLTIFADSAKGGFMSQAMPRKDGSIRRSGRVPEENARAARFLAELAVATHDAAAEKAARRTWDAFAKDQEKAGLGAADWALAIRAVMVPERPQPPAWQTAAREAEGGTPQVVRIRRGRR